MAQLEYRRTGSRAGLAGHPTTCAEDVVHRHARALAGRVTGRRCSSATPPVVTSPSGTRPRRQPQARGVVALAPVADLAEAYRLDLDGGAVAALLGGGPDENRPTPLPNGCRSVTERDRPR